jgi:hypothetical protein
MQRPLSPWNCFRGKQPSDDLFFYAAPGRVEVDFSSSQTILPKKLARSWEPVTVAIKRGVTPGSGKAPKPESGKVPQNCGKHLHTWVLEAKWT